MTFHRTRSFESARWRDRLRNALAGLRVGAVVTATEERRRHYLENNHVRTNKVRCIPLGIDSRGSGPMRCGARSSGSSSASAMRSC